MKMNKKEVIEKLKEELNISEEKCIIINNIIEDHFIIGKKNKEKIIEDLKKQLEVSETEANYIYNTFMSILGKGLEDKIKHPFIDYD